MGKTSGMGAARKLKKFRTKRLYKPKPFCEGRSWCLPQYRKILYVLPNFKICDKCGSRVPKEKEPKPDEWKKPERGIDAYNAFTSKCFKTYRFTGGKMVKNFLTNEYGGGSLLKGIDEDVVIAAFERDGDALDISKLDWT